MSLLPVSSLAPNLCPTLDLTPGDLPGVGGSVGACWGVGVSCHTGLVPMAQNCQGEGLVGI